MRVFRIAKARYANDLSGDGARLYGGRWNRPNIGLVYASCSRALATVEYLVHVPAAMVPKNLKIVTIEIPNPAVPDRIEIADLPEGWRRYPSPGELAERGSIWALSNRSLLLQVPSAVVEREYNVLINPGHPDCGDVEIVEVLPCVFDERLVR